MIIATAIFVLTMAMAIWQGVTRPVLNWDMIGYMGSIISMETDDRKIIHERVKEETKPVVSDAIYEDLFVNNRLSNDAGNFYRQLPFYHIKPLYVAAVALTHELGAGLAASTWYVSALAFAFLAYALYGWKPQQASRPVWLFSVSALTVLGYFPMAKLAAYSTPDAMTLAFMMLGIVAWYRQRSFTQFMVCMLLAIATRPDAMIQVMTLTFFLTFFAARQQRLSHANGAVAAVLAFAMYQAIQAAFGAAGWTELFYRGMIDDNFDFTKGHAHITWDQYKTAVLWGAGHIVENGRLRFFIALSVLALACHARKPGKQRPWMWLLLMAWGTFVVRFLLFPNWGDERYYYYYYLLVLIASLEMFAPLFAGTRFGRDAIMPLLLAIFTVGPVALSFYGDLRTQRVPAAPVPSVSEPVSTQVSGVDGPSLYNQGIAHYQKQAYRAAAANWLAASKQHYLPAYYSLGNLYANGQGVAPSYAKAVSLYRYAARRGDAQSQFALGYNYHYGNGVKQDPVESYFWLYLAAKAGIQGSVTERDKVKEQLSETQIDTVERRAKDWKPLS